MRAGSPWVSTAAIGAHLAAACFAAVLADPDAAALAAGAAVTALAGPELVPLSARRRAGPVALALGAGAACGALATGAPPVLALLLWGLASLHLGAPGLGGVAERLRALAAALLMVAGAAKSETATFLVAWGVWTATLPWALAPDLEALERAGPARRAIQRWAWAGVVPVFLASPRCGTRPEDASRTMSGWAAGVELGDFDRPDRDPAVIVRVAGLGEGPLRLRGAALDVFDGARWTAAGLPRTPATPTPPVPGARPVVASQVPLGGMVMVPGPVHDRRDGPDDLRVDAHGAWWSTADQVFRWSGFVVEGEGFGPAALDPASRARLLSWPASLDPRAVALAGTLAPPGTSAEVAIARVEAWLRAEVRWTPDDPPSRDALGAFLFDVRAGDCEYFATAAAVLLRVAGVPTRLALGLWGGAPSEGGVALRGADGHAWAEAYVEGRGWVVVDATAPVASASTSGPAAASTEDRGPRVGGAGASLPPVGDVAPATREVALPASPQGPPPPSSAPAPPPTPRSQGPFRRLMEFGPRQQADLLRGLAPCLALGGAAWWLAPRAWALAAPRRRPGRRLGVAGVWDGALDGLAQRGWVAPAGLSPLEAAAWAEREIGPEAAPLRALAWLHYEVAYGGASDEGRLEEARGLAAALAALPRRRARG